MHINEAHNFGIQQLLVSKAQKIEKSALAVTYLHNVYDLLNLFAAE